MDGGRMQERCEWTKEGMAGCMNERLRQGGTHIEVEVSIRAATAAGGGAPLQHDFQQLKEQSPQLHSLGTQP